MKKNTILFLLIISFWGLNAQTLSSIDPDNAEQGQELTVTITGTDTHFNQASGTTVSLTRGTTTYNGNNINAILNEEMEVDFSFPLDASTGIYDLNVFNNIDGSMNLNNAFEVLEASDIFTNDEDYIVFYSSQDKTLNIKVDNKIGYFYNLKIYNIKGTCVLTRTGLNSNYNNKIKLTGFNTGVFIANILIKNKIISYKFTKY